jgi:hypothetical protein
LFLVVCLSFALYSAQGVPENPSDRFFSKKIAAPGPECHRFWTYYLWQLIKIIRESKECPWGILSVPGRR